jgi:type I restriction enzyme S subunit
VKKYAEYKDSGIALVPRIPQNWEAKPLKYIADCNARVLPENTDEETEIVYIDIGSVNYGLGICNTQEFTFANAPSRARRVVESGDTIISTVRTYLKAIAYISDEYDGNICSTGFAVYTPKAGVNRRFLFYALNADWFVSDVERYSVGISYPAITSTALSSLKTILPPLAEQNFIVAYLDRRTAEIDALLADLQSQVEMLDAYKRELIAETVTKGLDKSAAMKDSGVDYIGMIPETWEATKNKWLFMKVKNIVGSDQENYPVLSLSIKGVIEKDREDNTGKIPAKYEDYYQIVEHGNLLLCLFDMDVTPCIIGYIPQNGIVSPAYSHYTPTNINAVSMKFYYWWFLYMQHSGLFISLSNNIRNSINADHFGALESPQPPIYEQERIAAYLDEKTAQVESLIADITAQIEKLKQYRQIVIHDAVTGKIKVTEG